MPARRAARLVVTLVALAPLACATLPDPETRRLRETQRAAALARVPANAPAGLFATGMWAGTLTGEPVMQSYGGNLRGPGGVGTLPQTPMLGQRVTRDFDVEVSAWRDSARVALAFEAVGAAGGRTGRMLPRALQVAGDTLTFGLPTLLGHRDVTCRLVASRAGTWDGPCHAASGDRAAVLTLAVPRAGQATGDR